MDAMPPRPDPPRTRASRLRDWIDWFGAGRLALTAASVLAVGAGGYWLLRPPPTPVETQLPHASASSTEPPPTGPTGEGPGVTGGVATGVGQPAPPDPAPPSTIVVHVAGAVVDPGVYRVPSSARVVDAVAAAGGASGTGRADVLNLAAPLRDGDRVYVPTADEAPVQVGGVSSAGPSTGTGGGAAAGPVGPVDLNAATVDELDRLPGVGPATAAAIVAHRDVHGPFASVDALADVRGIGPAKLDALRPLVTV